MVAFERLPEVTSLMLYMVLGPPFWKDMPYCLELKALPFTSYFFLDLSEVCSSLAVPEKVISGLDSPIGAPSAALPVMAGYELP